MNNEQLSVDQYKKMSMEKEKIGFKHFDKIKLIFLFLIGLPLMSLNVAFKYFLTFT